MKNLTEVSLHHKGLAWYFIIVVFLAGFLAYFRLGRMEDPSFTIRQMVVTAAWPGATAEQMEQQVTDKLEKRFQDLPGIDYIKSCTRAGTTIIYITLRDDVKRADIRPTWRDLRNFGEDVKAKLPEGVYGPYYNDRFDDVYGSIYAVTGDGYSCEELRQSADRARRLILRVPSVQKVELLGEQEEKVYIEIEKSKLSALGIPPTAIAAAVKTQNQIAPSAMLETETDNVFLRVTGTFSDVEAIRETPVSAGGRIFRLGDIAAVERRYTDPGETKMYFNGQPAVGIAVSMEPGGNVLQLGEDLNHLIAKIRAEEPAGLEISRVSDQPAVVEESIGDFVSSLREAVFIVLLVNFLSLGVRTGMVVAGCIPLVLAGALCVMYGLGIDLHKVSLGALIISLGLLVDDAIIAVEMMSVKLEEGMDRFHAACHAFNVTAIPMLTGTLITCSGFIPVAFSVGDAAEFCKSLFPVVASALLISWIVSVMVAPLFGTYLIRVKKPAGEDGAPVVLYQTPFYQLFRRVLGWFLRHRGIVLIGTAAFFAVSVFLLQFVKQEFFPPSLRPEILVEMRLPEGSSRKATDAEAARFAAFLDERMDSIDNYSYYVGDGAPRFVLTKNPLTPAPNIAQFVIVAKDVDTRKKLTAEVRRERADDVPNVRVNLQLIQTGPPADYPVMLRVAGEDKDRVRALATEVAGRLLTDDNYTDVHLDWNEKSKALRLELDQDKLRGMGISSQELAQTLYTEISGTNVAEYYRGDRTIGIQLRLPEQDRGDLETLKELPVYLGAKGYVPLEQIAKISYEAEDGVIWRRNLNPTVTVQANIRQGTGDDAAKKALAMIADLRDDLPLGYTIEPGGSLEDSAKSMKNLMVPMPGMLLVIMTLLMIQLGNGKDMLLTILTVPLCFIGISAGMLLTGAAMGFVAILGILSLSGMIIRNTVVLIDQIRQHLAEGAHPWDAVVDSAIMRSRPIMLTAATTILSMLPMMPNPFWQPMAVAIASGLLVATILTLLIFPAMYAAMYHIEEPEEKG